MNNPAVNSVLVSPAILLLVMASTVSIALAGSVTAPYQIGTWEGFRPAAISYTFDDDCPNQYAEAVPMFHTNGLKMTLFTVTGWVGGSNAPSWAQVKQAASYGDEIASHTVSHPSLTTVTATQLTNELVNSQNAINSYITNQSCLTLAYPNCAVPSETVVGQYYFAARTCSGSLVPITPSDFLQISSYILGNAGGYTTGDSINALANYAFATGQWCVYLTHAIDGDSGFSPLPSAALQSSVNYTSTNQGKFWVETFGNVVRYIKERNASSVAETANTGSSITVQVTNNLNVSIFNYPITLRRPLPANWPAAAVSQNGSPVSAQLVTVSSTNYVMFDVVPNGGDVVLTETVLPFNLSNAALTPPGSLTLQLNGQSNAAYALDASTDLLNWLPVQTNTLTSTSASFTVDASSNSVQFYRAHWVK